MKQSFKAMQVIHFALCMGVILFASVTLFLKVFELEPNITKAMQPFLLIAALVALGGATLSRVLPNTLLSKLNKEDEAGKKFATFQTASILKWALLEGPALINIVFFLLQGHLFFLLVGAFLLILLFSNRPTVESASRATGINYTEFQ